MRQFDVPLGTTSAGAFLDDINAGTLPERVRWSLPNLQNDAARRVCRSMADDWLALWMPRLMAGPDYQSGQPGDRRDLRRGHRRPTRPSRSYVVSPTTNHTVVTTRFDHYALARLYSDILGTPPLNAAASAPGLRAAFGL